MGYSHIWRQSKEVDPTEWREITDAFGKVLKALPPEVKVWGSDIRIVAAGEREVVVYDEVPDPGKPPLVNDIAICFEGGCEAMTLLRVPLKGGRPQFTKTEKAPYDVVVVALLTIANHFAPGAWQIGSGGDAKDWEPGLKLVRTATGIDMGMPILEKG